MFSTISKRKINISAISNFASVNAFNIIKDKILLHSKQKICPECTWYDQNADRTSFCKHGNFHDQKCTSFSQKTKKVSLMTRLFNWQPILSPFSTMFCSSRKNFTSFEPNFKFVICKQVLL